jgi:hypothetical protein
MPMTVSTTISSGSVVPRRIVPFRSRSAEHTIRHLLARHRINAGRIARLPRATSIVR